MRTVDAQKRLYADTKAILEGAGLKNGLGADRDGILFYPARKKSSALPEEDILVFCDQVPVVMIYLADGDIDALLASEAVAAVEAHLDDCAFSADMFAEAMNMSRSNLHIKMKALTGSSSMDFIRKIRLSKACELLKDGRYSVAEVSDMVGYSSPAYFTTSFKKHFGCLPSEYK